MRLTFANCLLLATFAVPVVAITALVTMDRHDVSTAPAFAMIGALTFLVSAASAVVVWVRRRRPPWPWLGATISNFAVAFLALFSIDFRGRQH